VVVAKAPGIVGAAVDLAIQIEVITAHQAGVGGEVLHHRIADGRYLCVLGVSQIVVVEGFQIGGALAFAVVVELVEQEHIRAGALDDLRHVADLLHVLGFGFRGAAQAPFGEAGQQGILLGAGQCQLTGQHTGSRAIKSDIKRGKANHGDTCVG